MIDTPPSLDAHILTATLSTTVSQHFLETLFTFTEKYEPVPHLAKSAEVRDGGKLILIQLRQGVLFHNGKEMTSDDVVASLNRWGKFGARAPALFRHVERVVADGKYGVRIQLKNPFAPWATLLAYANGGPTIFPKEVMENATKQPIPPSGYIGTGPYRFVDWKAGHEIILERFDKYVKRTEKSDGYAGERVAYFDKLVFVPVADPGTRVNGIKAGEYDYAEYIPGDLFEGLEKDASVADHDSQGGRLRRALLQSEGGHHDESEAAPSHAGRHQHGAGPQRLGRSQEALGLERRPDAPRHQVVHEGRPWRRYSQNNAAKARALAKEAGYKGETIRYMVTTSYADHYSASVVLAKQLKDAGFNIDLQIYDWATLVSRRAQSGALGRVLHHPRIRPGSHPVHLHESRPTPAGGTRRGSSSTPRNSPPLRIPPSAWRPWRSSRPSSIRRCRWRAPGTPSPTTSTIPSSRASRTSTLLNFPSFWNVWKK